MGAISNKVSIVSNQNAYVDIEQLVREARLQRSAAIGQMVVRCGEFIGRTLKHAFVLDKTEAYSKRQSRHSVKLSSLGNLR